MKHFSYLIGSALFIFALAFIAGIPSDTYAQQNTPNFITVTTHLDTVVTNGQCSLREAINNTNSGTDTSGGDCAAGGTTPYVDELGNTVSNTIRLKVIHQINLQSNLPYITRGVSIQGYGDAENKKLDGAGNYRFFVSQGHNISLQNVTIRNAVVQSSSGGVVFISGSNATLKIRDVSFKKNYSSLAGGALHVSGGASLYVRNTLFRNNQSGKSAGAISLNGAKNVHIDRVTFVNNTAQQYYGGAIGIWGGNNLGTHYLMNNSTFVGNEAAIGGGAIYKNGFMNNVYVIQNSFNSNTAGSGGSDIGAESANSGASSVIQLYGNTFTGTTSPLYLASNPVGMISSYQGTGNNVFSSPSQLYTLGSTDLVVSTAMIHGNMTTTDKHVHPIVNPSHIAHNFVDCSVILPTGQSATANNWRDILGTKRTQNNQTQCNAGSFEG